MREGGLRATACSWRCVERLVLRKAGALAGALERGLRGGPSLRIVLASSPLHAHDRSGLAFSRDGSDLPLSREALPSSKDASSGPARGVKNARMMLSMAVVVMMKRRLGRSLSREGVVQSFKDEEDVKGKRVIEGSIMLLKGNRRSQPRKESER